MKKENFQNRIFTSIFLILLLYLSFNYSYILVISLILISVFSWIEFTGLISKIFNNKNFGSNFLKLILQIICLIYLTIFSVIIFFGIFDQDLKFFGYI